MQVVERLERMIATARRGPALDRSVHDELIVDAAGLGLPGGLDISWLGTAGFALTCEGTTVLIDPFVTRRGLRSTLTSRSLQSDPVLVDRYLPSADAVLLGHCHFDHAVDVPALAAAGATVYGSASAHHLIGLSGFADRAVEVEPHRPYEVGPFTVRFVPSLHSKLLAGLAVPADGELTCDSLDRLGSNAYRCGQVWGIHIEVAGATLYHQGSANLIEDEYRYGPVDVFLCGIAGRYATRNFTTRALRTFRPTRVVAHHHDDFFRPLDAQMGFSFNVNLSGFVEDVHRIDPDLAIHTMRPPHSSA